MVTFNASGPVMLYRSEGRVRNDGSDDAPIEISRQQHTETHETVEIFMPNGHVNLEAYAPRSYGLGVAEVIDVEAMCPPGWDEAEIDGRDWDVELTATPDEWIRAAVRWSSERPGKTVLTALEKFEGWDETDDDRRAIRNAIDGVGENDMGRVLSAYEQSTYDVPEWLDAENVR